ncbi:MAG: TnpV protein [Ruminococcus sp.]|nr:TnpV protein [Ruminococcus sp.]
MNLPKEKIENGILYVLNEETMTYRPTFPGDNEEDTPTIYRYGRMREKYLKENYKATYSKMLMCGELVPHLVSIDEQAAEMEEKIVAAMAKADGTDEELKARNPLAWVGLMNNYKMSAQEIIIKELIEAY